MRNRSMRSTGCCSRIRFFRKKILGSASKQSRPKDVVRLGMLSPDCPPSAPPSASPGGLLESAPRWSRPLLALAAAALRKGTVEANFLGNPILEDALNSSRAQRADASTSGGIPSGSALSSL